MTPRAEAAIRASFSAQTLMETFGAAITSLEPGLCIVSAPILAGARQQHGHGHPGLVFSLGEAAALHAAQTMPDTGNELLTAEMKINLLAPARGERLTAEGRVEKCDKAFCVATAAVYAVEGPRRTKIAVLQGTMVPATN